MPNLTSTKDSPPIEKILRNALLPCLLVLLIFSSVPESRSSELTAYADSSQRELRLDDPAGSTHELGDYRGSLVLVHFWASWCAPCVREIPSLQRLVESMDGRPFTLLAINVGEQPRRAETAGKRLGLKSRLLLDKDSKVFDAWQAEAVPTTFVIDATGQMRYRVQGPMDWDRKDIRDTLQALLP